jgi:WD40 repeat protein
LWDLSGDEPEFKQQFGERQDENPYASLSASQDGSRIALPYGNALGRVDVWKIDWAAVGGPQAKRLSEVAGTYCGISPKGDELVTLPPGSYALQRYKVTADSVTLLDEIDCSGLHFRAGAIALSPDGNHLAFSNGLFARRDGEWKLESDLDCDHVNAVVFSPDGKTLVAGTMWGSVRAWDLTQSPPQRRGAKSNNVNNRLAFSPDGRTLATNGNECAVWDVSGGVPKLRGRLPPGTRITPPTFSADSNLVLVPHVGVWSLEEDEPRQILPPAKDAAWPWFFAPDGKHVVDRVWSNNKPTEITLTWQPWKLNADGKIEFGEVDRTWMPAAPVRNADSLLVGFQLSCDRATIRNDTHLQVWNLNVGVKPLLEIATSVTHSDQRLSPNGKQLVAWQTDGLRPTVWDLAESPPRASTLEIPAAYPSDAVFSADGSLLIVCD